MRRAHLMPFGAQLTQDGQARFRLWAPAARSVDLCLEGARQAVMPMAPGVGGWFELVTGEAGVGSHYRFRIDGDMRVPDPASRFQPEDVHGPSEVVSPDAWEWLDGAWTGRPWEETVLYELHVGAFTPAGTFRAIEERLDYLVDLGVTAIELMPVADFPGARNWGYDGVLPFAPDSRYGRPEDLKYLIQAAHLKGLMVLLDVVYNHFGPEGNYLHVYAPQFFTQRHHTPWGAAINFDGPNSRTVRDFFIHNALYWLEEFHLDGLRLDAVHAIMDDSRPDILVDLAEAVRRGPGRQRHVHLVLENDDNAARYLARQGDGTPRWYVAQWNDDIHHALHVALTGQTDGYYLDYAERPIESLGRCLSEGFAYQGQPSVYRDGERRGEPSRDLPPTAFVSFLQNHDQVGNRAFGERITALTQPAALQAAMAVVLLAPSPPLLFMGEEFGATEPFLFFCDFGPDLAAAVTEGRRGEFARFEQFNDPAARQQIPDPSAEETFARSRLDWSRLSHASHARCLDLCRELLRVRRRDVIPRLVGVRVANAGYRLLGDRALLVYWRLGDGAVLHLLANLGDEILAPVEVPGGRLLCTVGERVESALAGGRLPPWSVAWLLEGGAGDAAE